MEVTGHLDKAVLAPDEEESLIGLVLIENGVETLETTTRDNSSRVFIIKYKMNKEMRQFLEGEVRSSKDNETKQRGTL